ncbi:hypothetical protein HELRODRAFT_189109 [Helobdella robusta]|uniref:WSC domain-containing protein n=1 Tax=Helobdella robusta TaxID=6412 RepID=T1FQN8_HELRO|nr:hypothetical protein HELRODRAFT_189109 [Helobdella robusta]ESN96102.1 hypothetical protein HELRODRAFT_189109 [Helobdella robusta]
MYLRADYTNVALKKTAYNSNNSSSAQVGVDGDIYNDLLCIAASYNPPWFVVDLLNGYQVKHVVLYNRRDCTGCDYRLYMFMVGLFNNFDPNVNKTIVKKSYDLCGQWPTTVFTAGQPMRIDCANEKLFSKFVIIQQWQDSDSLNIVRQFEFAELEVYANADRLSNFKVGLSNNFDPRNKNSILGNYELCAKWPGIGLYGKQPMKVICTNKTFYSRYVIVQPTTNVDLTFGEMEVYGTENSTEKFYGCFKTFQTQKTFNESSLEICLSLCKQSDINYATVKMEQDKKTCFCGTPVEPYPSYSFCSSSCDASGVCTETSIYAVYMAKTPSINWTYMGCYQDRDDKDLVVQTLNLDTMTVETCTQKCYTRNFLFAGLQYGLCFCGNSFGKYGRAKESDCSGGNLLQKCGGKYFNSLYFLYNTYGTNKSYSDIYHCSNQSNFTPWLTCESKSCDPGWNGDACDKRDCLVNNGNCGTAHRCYSFKVGAATLTECVCKSGYMKTYYNDDCISYIYPGAEKCPDNKLVCKKPSEICASMNGSYVCQCSSGYERINNVCSVPIERQVMIAFVVIAGVFLLANISLIIYICYKSGKWSKSNTKQSPPTPVKAASSLPPNLSRYHNTNVVATNYNTSIDEANDDADNVDYDYTGPNFNDATWTRDQKIISSKRNTMISNNT